MSRSIEELQNLVGRRFTTEGTERISDFICFAMEMEFPKEKEGLRVSERNLSN